VEDESVNLCNKCGLQFKSGKLDKTGGEQANPDPGTVGGGSPVGSVESSQPDQQDPSEETGPFVCYSMERQADEGVARKVLFYVHDADGNEKLALTGYDSRGTGHFLYESAEGFTPELKCKNRTLVIAWLREMGATRSIERPSEGQPTQSKKSSKVPSRPTLSREYVDFRVDSGKDGETGFENFYLIDTEGRERIAICGNTHRDCSQYRCVLQEVEAAFDDRAEAVGWLEWLIGKVEAPPYRFLKKEPRKPVRTRESYTSSLAEGGDSKRRMSNDLLEDVQAVFGDNNLMRWVLRKPSSEEIEKFHQWRKQLAVENTPDGTTDADKNTGELLETLRLVQKSETCLKLLEVSSLGRPISALRRHPNPEVAQIASEITKTWNDLTTRALEKASEARKRNAPLS